MLSTTYESVILPVKRNLQDYPYSCGAASLKIITDTLGKNFSEDYLMRTCNTSLEIGTTPEAIIKALENFKIEYVSFPKASITLVENAIKNLNLCLVDYQAWAENGEETQSLEAGHYSVIFGYNKDHFFIADPAKHRTEKYSEWGFRTIRKDLFNKHWKDMRADGEKTFHWMLAVPLFQDFCS